jgi:hypothetical protein
MALVSTRCINSCLQLFAERICLLISFYHSAIKILQLFREKQSLTFENELFYNVCINKINNILFKIAEIWKKKLRLCTGLQQIGKSDVSLNFQACTFLELYSRRSLFLSA